MQSISYEMLDWMNHKLQLRLPEEISKPQIYRWYHFNGRKWRGTREPLEERKLNIQKTKIIASGTITSWKIEGEKMETIPNFIFLGSKITEDSDCSHEIKKTFASWKKNYDKHRQCIKKQRYHFTNKGPNSQILVFQ